MSEAPTYPISKHALQMWKRMMGWYGHYLKDAFGLFPPEDWCTSMDKLKGKAQEDAVMMQLRARHTTYPPKFPEFDRIVEDVLRPPPTASAADVVQQLVEYAHRAKLVPPDALLTWTTLHRGEQVTAIAIPRLSGKPVIVTLLDMNQAAAIQRLPAPTDEARRISYEPPASEGWLPVSAHKQGRLES